MKFLCVCNHGNVRSACLARELKDRGHEAIALGICPLIPNNPWRGFPDESINIFCWWADKIIDMSDGYGKRITSEFQSKVTRVDIWPDRWFNPFHPELRQIIQQQVLPRVL